MNKVTFITPNFAVTGALSPQDFPEIRAMGFTAVVSNLPDGESAAYPTAIEEAKLAEAAGLAFRHVPTTKFDLFTDRVVGGMQTALGATILAIAALMWRSQRLAQPELAAPDRLSSLLGLRGTYHDPAAMREVDWQIHRTPAGLALFAVIGLMAGMFGLGAGWANVPVLNLVLGAPLKLSVATSGVVLSVVDTSAAWIYLHSGAILPLITVPSLVGVMLGAKVGARLLRVAPAATVRAVVIALLLVAGTRALLKGTGVWN